MAPVMRLTLRWEEGKDKALHTTLKIKLPAKWKEGPTANLKTTFLEHYNSKHPENKLDGSSVHLLNPKGELLADEDMVIKVLNPSDTVRVKPGAPPSLQQAEEIRNSVIKKKVPSRSTKIDGDEGKERDDAVGHVTDAAALKKAADPKFSFDYSKWDRLDLSDDDGEDCHPNIEMASWKRLRGRQRTERREAEDKKVGKYNEKIEKHTKKAEKLRKEIDGGADDPQLVVDLEEAQTAVKDYEGKLEAFLESRKLIADDVCEVYDDKGLVVPVDHTTDENGVKKAVYPEPEHKQYDNYDDFQKENRHYLKTFSSMRNELDSQEFLLEHPQLLCDHAEGFLLLLTLDTCMKHQLTERDPTVTKDEKRRKHERLLEYTVGKQHLTLHYVCELAKSLKRDPREGIKPFFDKAGKKAKDKVEGFEEDLGKFLDRIRARAAEKISKGEIASLVEAESSLADTGDVLYEAAGVGPGGLDPNEVLQSLPEELQDAFVSQNTEKLQASFEAMTTEDAEYHLKRCIDSGLWVPGGGAQDGEEEDYEEVLEGEESVADKTAVAEDPQ